MVERIRSREADTRRAAFGELVEGYWKPVYKHLRLTWQLSADEAQDVTQAFFAEAFEKAWLEGYEPSKARFRTFVRVCADRFVMNWRQAATRLKRGGAAVLVPLDFPDAEREVLLRGVATPPDADEFFHQEYIRALFGRALERVRAEYAALGRDVHVRLFERYDIEPVEGTSYATLAREFELTPAQVTNYLFQVRRSFRQHAIDALRALSGSDDHFRAEARELFGLDVE